MGSTDSVAACRQLLPASADLPARGLSPPPPSQPLSADNPGSVHIVLLIEIFHTWKESKILCRLGLETLSTSLLPTHPLTRAMSTDNCTPRAVGIEDIMELSEETDWKLPQPLLKYPTPVLRWLSRASLPLLVCRKLHRDKSARDEREKLEWKTLHCGCTLLIC